MEMQGDTDRSVPRRLAGEAKCSAATGTSQGLINLDYWDRDDEWSIYEKVTETALLHPKLSARVNRKPPELRNIAKSANGIRKRTPRLAMNKRIVLDDGFHRRGSGEIIFDERADGDKIRDVASLSMRNSLFPHVPPYVLFRSHDCGTPEKLPKNFNQLLRWKLTANMPRILMKILVNSGCPVVSKNNYWSAAWYPCSSDSSKYQRLKSYQKVTTLSTCLDFRRIFHDLCEFCG